MAKDIIFDSERYEKRQTVKRYLIPAAVLVGLIVAAVVAALLLRGSRGKPVTGGEDTPYPYTWAAGKNGSVILEVDRTAAPGYLWLPAAAPRQMDISVMQDAQEGKTQFTLTPLEAGRCVLQFRLQRPEDPDDCIYELSALSNTDFDGKRMTASLLSVSSRPLLGLVRGGEGTLCPYTLRQDEDGDVVVYLTDMEPELPEDAEASGDGTDKKEGAWQCVSDNQGVLEFMGAILSDEGVAFYLRPGAEPGEAQVRMWKTETGTELRMDFALDESGMLLLLSHELKTGSLPAGTTD